jgi:hypothetical protein
LLIAMTLEVTASSQEHGAGQRIAATGRWRFYSAGSDWGSDAAIDQPDLKKRAAAALCRKTGKMCG